MVILRYQQAMHGAHGKSSPVRPRLLGHRRADCACYPDKLTRNRGAWSFCFWLLALQNVRLRSLRGQQETRQGIQIHRPYSTPAQSFNRIQNRPTKSVSAVLHAPGFKSWPIAHSAVRAKQVGRAESLTQHALPARGTSAASAFPHCVALERICNGNEALPL